MQVSNRLMNLWLKPLLFLASLGPVVYLTWAALHNELGADPFRGATREAGAWTLRFLSLTLAVTPFRRLTQWHSVIKCRRMLGLFAFFYGTVHFLMYVIFDRFAGLDFRNGTMSWITIGDLTATVGSDIVKRPFLAIGLTGFMIMAPLAVTSTAAMIRRLGGRRWRWLHRLIYVATIAGLLHHWWPLSDRFRLDSYGVIVGALLAYRIYHSRVRTPQPRRSMEAQSATQ
jgi:sulfoxide reductase heme-binding subunit YedZ